MSNEELEKKIKKIVERYYLSTGDKKKDFFPQKIKLYFTKDNFNQMSTELEEFNNFIKGKHEFEIEYQCLNTKKWGKQTIPSYLRFDNINQLIHLTRKGKEYQRFIEVTDYLKSQFKEFINWPQYVSDVRDILHYSLDEWRQIVEVARFLGNQQREEIFIREIPVSTSTKFYEQNKRIIKKIIMFLFKDLNLEYSDDCFETILRIKRYPSLIRIRFLDQNLQDQLKIKFSDFAVSVEDMNKMIEKNNNYPPNVVICENKESYFSLPKIPNSLAIFGEGVAVLRLKKVIWLQKSRLIYWGDIDAKGFEILADLREAFPHVRSLMMDWPTWEQFKAYCISTAYKGASILRGTLSTEEMSLYQLVKEQGMLLEQEKISKEYVFSKFEAL
ncbi:MAG: hypothetical protein A2381_17455 [Bdellovibrionales bacterium RIFOXYB1_FULL_37_110]|nr:MAG: hypothetical protein A2181_00975 [Bdellovibrionales bacterium RIFOXYA1_FULL_38_20]OFZ48065.1 MAG: hypothetical protein A2417_15445 [Bdellovibrionales bacterium RIFOXYC1_FULL_37_79]OFZ58073.1 MAG: hypothetical protein A2381_17455 [Bdellovibrionales bacterium RIFOXYB1_FULL_37_110]OFZ63358.1 MAG: hypothetical protein A2577_17575 [Bdellovibrionales bacterium RIFOXYD1_FULL_36_51]